MATNNLLSTKPKRESFCPNQPIKPTQAYNQIGSQAATYPNAHSKQSLEDLIFEPRINSKNSPKKSGSHSPDLITRKEDNSNTRNNCIRASHFNEYRNCSQKANSNSGATSSIITLNPCEAPRSGPLSLQGRYTQQANAAGQWMHTQSVSPSSVGYSISNPLHLKRQTQSHDDKNSNPYSNQQSSHQMPIINGATTLKKQNHSVYSNHNNISCNEKSIQKPANNAIIENRQAYEFSHSWLESGLPAVCQTTAADKQVPSKSKEVVKKARPTSPNYFQGLEKRCGLIDQKNYEKQGNQRAFESSDARNELNLSNQAKSQDQNKIKDQPSGDLQTGNSRKLISSANTSTTLTTSSNDNKTHSSPQKSPQSQNSLFSKDNLNENSSSNRSSAESNNNSTTPQSPSESLANNKSTPEEFKITTSQSPAEENSPLSPMVSLQNYKLFISSDQSLTSANNTKSSQHFRTARHQALLNQHLQRRQSANSSQSDDCSSPDTKLQQLQDAVSSYQIPFGYSPSPDKSKKGFNFTMPEKSEKSPNSIDLLGHHRLPLCENNKIANSPTTSKIEISRVSTGEKSQNRNLLVYDSPYGGGQQNLSVQKSKTTSFINQEDSSSIKIDIYPQTEVKLKKNLSSPNSPSNLQRTIDAVGLNNESSQIPATDSKSINQTSNLQQSLDNFQICLRRCQSSQNRPTAVFGTQENTLSFLIPKVVRAEHSLKSHCAFASNLLPANVANGGSPPSASLIKSRRRNHKKQSSNNQQASIQKQNASSQNQQQQQVVNRISQNQNFDDKYPRHKIGSHLNQNLTISLKNQQMSKENSSPIIEASTKAVLQEKAISSNKPIRQQEKEPAAKVEVKQVVCFRSPRTAIGKKKKERVVFAISPSRIELAPNSKLKQKHAILITDLSTEARSEVDSKLESVQNIKTIQPQKRMI